MAKSNQPIVKLKIPEDFNPIIDIRRKDKVGCQIGNMTLITKKERYHKYRNIMVNVLGVKGLVFRQPKKKK